MLSYFLQDICVVNTSLLLTCRSNLLSDSLIAISVYFSPSLDDVGFIIEG